MRKLCIWMMILGAIVTSCSPKIVPKGPWVKKIDSEDLSRLVINYSVELKKEQHLSLEDSWVAYDENIKKVCVRFSSQRLLTVEQARLQIVKVVEGLLIRLNNHALLSYQLERFPITAGELDVKINYESFYGAYVDELYVGLTWLQCGCVHFYAFDRKDPKLDWDHSRFEPYFKSRELALLKEEADLPFTDKSALSNKVDYRSFGRFQGYSPNRAIEERCESQPRPKPIVLMPGRDDWNPSENIQTIRPMGSRETELPGETDDSDEFYSEGDYVENFEDLTSEPNSEVFEESIPYDRNDSFDSEFLPYQEDLRLQGDFPENDSYREEIMSGGYHNGNDGYYTGGDYYKESEGYPESGYGGTYFENRQAPDYRTDILDRNIDAGSYVPDILNTRINPGSPVPDPGFDSIY